MATTLPSFRTHTPVFPIVTGRPKIAGDRALALALLAGCVIGLALSWHTVLSESARERIAETVTGFGSVPGMVDGVPAQASAEHGMNPPAPRRPEAALAVWPEVPPASPSVPESSRPEAVPPAADLPAVLLAASPPPAPPAPVAMREEAMEVTFQLNSSFLPAGATESLQRFLGHLPQDRPLRLELRATVSDDGVKTDDAVAAARYNRWLAERRVARIKEFVERHGGGRITVTTGFVEHDPSRRVLIGARSAP